MLRWRLVLGVLLAAVFAGVCWIDYYAAQPGPWLLAITAVLALAASSELLGMFAGAGLNVGGLSGVVYGGNLAVVAANLVPLLSPWLPKSDAGPLGGLAWPLLAALLAMTAAFLLEMARYRQPGGVTVRLALAAFSLIYVGLLLSVLFQLRYLGGNQAGLLGLLALTCVVKMGDIGAYTVGRLFGRSKLVPRLSPGKTWEGAGGGILFSVFAAWLVIENWGPLLVTGLAVPAWAWVGYGVLVSITGMAGDLAESLLKRDLGCKDSSRWMPGFGGVLDILDSVLLAGPVGYLCWLAALALSGHV